jgi:hypothetical protein
MLHPKMFKGKPHYLSQAELLIPGFKGSNNLRPPQSKVLIERSEKNWSWTKGVTYHNHY